MKFKTFSSYILCSRPRRATSFRTIRALAAFLIAALAMPFLAHGADIAVGVIAGLTRLGSTYGQGIVQGAQMAVREINMAGGINGQKVVLKIVDDASDPARSAIAMRRLVAANVNVVVGGWGSSQVLTNLEVAEDAGMPYVVVGATNPRITSQRNNWTFRVVQTDSVMVRHLAKLAINQFEMKRIAVISDSNSYGIGNLDEFIAELSELDLSPVDVQSYHSGDTNFLAQLNSIKAARPDGVFIFGTIPAAPLIMKQARALGINAQFFGTAGLANGALLTMAPKASDGTVLMTLFDEHATTASKDWSRRYRVAFADDHSVLSPVLAVWEYLAIRHIVAPCLKTSGTNRITLRDCIANWRGHLFNSSVESYFDQFGQLVQPPPVVAQIREGRFQILAKAKGPKND